MVTRSKDNLEQESKNETPLNSPSVNMSSDWSLTGTSLANLSMGLMIPSSSPRDAMDSPSCSGVPMMMNSFCPTVWDLPTNAQTLGPSEMNVPQSGGFSNAFGIGMEKRGMFLPAVPQMLPQSLAQIPADSGFIERAARFSCFSGGNFGDMMNPFGLPEPVNPYFRSLASLHRPEEVSGPDRLRTTRYAQPQGNGMKLDANLKEGSPLKNVREDEHLDKSREEVKLGGGGSEMGSEESGFSGRGDQEELDGADGRGCSAKGFSMKKKKRISQGTEFDGSKGVPQPSIEATKHHAETKQKEGRNANSTPTKLGGKNGKQAPQTSDPTKEEYIHVRARRGQATNSHSLAERVRRERISERMKFLQDLVPGCSKVTGKAVMLDEIINYVQSLQRQVEFLSMKLATVNPRLDFDIESLLAKEILQSRAGPSSSLAFAPDMTMQYPALHPASSGLVQSGLLGLGASADSVRRSISSQLTNMGGGFSGEPTSHVPGAWEDELHNVIQMSLNSTDPLGGQDLSAAPLPPDQMKAEH